jgi:hypothetical protein
MKHKLLPPKAVLGAIALSVQPWLLTIKAGDLAEVIKRSHVDDGTITVGVFGVHHTTATCVVTAAALTVAQMLAASLFMVTVESSASAAQDRFLRTLSAGGWILLAMVEFVSSVACANGGLPQKAMALSLAMILTMLESCAGILIIDNLIIPATQGVAESIRRALSRKRRPTRNRKPRSPSDKSL